MCLKWYQHFEHRWAKGQGLESSWVSAMLPGSNRSPCDGGPCPPGHVFLQSGSTTGFLFCYSLIILQQCPGQTFFTISWPESLFQTRWSLKSLPNCYIWFYDSRWDLAHSPFFFPCAFAGTQLTSVGCRTWQHTWAECCTSSSFHHIMICSSCLITPRYSLCCLWLIRC